MPIQRCSLPDGSKGYRYGTKGKCYKSKRAAIAQMRAMFANGYRGKASQDNIDTELEKEIEKEWNNMSNAEQILANLEFNLSQCKECNE